MGQISSILRNGEDNQLFFWCPGCNMVHGVKFGAGSGPRWSWNGDIDKPTFTPSLLIRYYKVSQIGRDMIKRGEHLAEGERYPGTDEVCHSFVTAGRIQFLNDCTHHLAGQTVDLPVWDNE